MFNNGDDGYGAGFDVSGFRGPGDTPQNDKKGVKRSDCIVPVTIRQVHNSSEVKIGTTGVESAILKIVGIVKKIVRSSVKVTYTVEDNTGMIDGVHWLEADSDESFVVPVVENTYCKMIGSLRQSDQQDKKFIMVFHMFPVTDLNEVTQHTLQVIYINLKSEELNQQTPQPDIKQQMSSTYGAMDTSMGGGTDYASGFNLNPQQQRVLKAVAQNSSSNDGAHVDQIMNSLTVKMPMKELEKILEFLASEGHVYSTHDEKHFKATDSFNY